jgi:hypothetical protein
MALRLEDEDERIANQVKLFFHELSKKGMSYTTKNFFLINCSRLPCHVVVGWFYVKRKLELNRFSFIQ